MEDAGKFASARTENRKKNTESVNDSMDYNMLQLWLMPVYGLMIL